MTTAALIAQDIHARLPVPWVVYQNSTVDRAPNYWIEEYPGNIAARFYLDGQALTLIDCRPPTEARYHPTIEPYPPYVQPQWRWDLNSPTSLTAFERTLRELGVPLADPADDGGVDSPLKDEPEPSGRPPQLPTLPG